MMLLSTLSVLVMVVKLQANMLGVIMYADDLILISASCTDLRQMIKICELEMSWLDMHFNAKKSCLVRCGPRYSKDFADILLNGAPSCLGLRVKLVLSPNY